MMKKESIALVLLCATQGGTTKESHAYDPVGNRLSNLSGSGWSNNTSNELTSGPGVTYTFNASGNTATKNDSSGITTYAWDYENRLTSVTLPGILCMSLRIFSIHLVSSYICSALPSISPPKAGGMPPLCFTLPGLSHTHRNVRWQTTPSAKHV